MTNNPIPLDVALINLYSNTRKAPLTLEEHDANRAYVDVLAQALNIELQWTLPPQPEVEAKPVVQSSDAPKQIDLVGLNKITKKKY